MKKSRSFLLFVALVLAASVQAGTLIPFGANWRYVIGLQEASAPVDAWRALVFNDSSWAGGPTPIGYPSVPPNDPNGWEATIQTMLPTSTDSNWLSVYFRKTFVITNNIADVASLNLAVRIDDGYVLWINGSEVRRTNVNPGQLAYNSNALGAGEATEDTTNVTSNLGSLLVQGTNIIAIHGFNAALSSSDFLLDVQLAISIQEFVPPTVANKNPAPGSINNLTQIVVTFSEPVQGVNASDLLVNGQPATGVTASPNGDEYTFTFPQPAYGSVSITWAGNHGIADFAASPNPFDPLTAGNTWSYTLVDNVPPVMSNILPLPNSEVRTLTRIEVLFSEDVTGVDASDLLINNVPATGLEFGVPGQFTFTFPQPPTGMVQVAFVSNPGIQDRATVPNQFAGGEWTYTLNPNVASFDVRINEFLADNGTGIRDEDGSREDWIELYNGGATPVDLAGWFLTDDSGMLNKWRFPTGVQMGPNTYLLVWASGKDRTNIAALHTNFKLDKNTGEYLALVLPDGVSVVSAFAPAYPPQRTDASYGRDRLDPNIVGFYNTPTPNAPNSISGPGSFASDVKYSRDSGTFVTPFNLTLSTASTNAVIRYVLITNAAQASLTLTNIPTTNSPIYTSAIPISVTTEVRARAFESGLFPSTPMTESYILISSNVLNFSSDIPVCVVHMLGNGSIPATATSGILMSFDNDNGRSSLTNTPQLATRMGVHIRGSSTLGQAKSNLRLETWDEFNQDAKYPLLGMPADSDWVFYGINGFDPGLMHNAIYQWLGRTIGIPSMRTRFVEMFRKIDNGPVTTNDYFGLYLLLETPKVGKDRLDISELRDQDTNAPAITGGYLMKIDRVDNERSFSPPVINGLRTTPAAIAFTDPPYRNTEADPRRLLQINYAQTYILSFLTNLSGANTTNPVTGYAQYINPDQWVNHLIANIIPFNVDGYRLSGFFYKPRSGRLEQGPMWDCDRCMGTGGTTTPQGDNRCFSPRFWRLPASDVNTDNGTDFFGVSNVGVSWFTPLFRDPNFWQLFIDRYQNLRTNEYSTNAIVAMIDGFYNEIKEAQVREQARWGSASASFTWPRSGVQTIQGYTFDFGPADNFGRGRYTNEVNFQKKWLIDRLEFLDTNFLNMPTLSSGTALVPSGTQVAVTPAAKANTLILYTLTGDDPRLSGGGISPSAKTNTGTLTLIITNNVRLFARCYNTSHANLTNSGTEVGKPLINSFWSGPVAATYYTSLPALRITEIMYNPPPPPAGNTNDADNFEYLELKNTGATPLNLNRFRLRGGIEFDFTNNVLAAGSNIVVVKNVSAFTTRYGAGIPIAGVYSNNLGNGGDHLVLQGGVREPILDFDYKDSWYPVTDGAGFSLQIVDENAPPNTWGLKQSWRPSGVVNGTPGANDPGAPTIPTIYVNEALTHTVLPASDAIELVNPNGTNVNIGGWFLTDSFNSPTKYRITAGTIVPAQGYLVLYETNSYGSAFGLSSKGEEVYLFSGGANTNLTGYAHGFDFGAQAANVTFGRHVISTGNDHFVAQSTPTLGVTNAGPLVGPIVLSEINYHPPDVLVINSLKNNSRDEYIELQNISGTNTPLYDSAFPANTWHLRDAVDYTFPPGVSLPAGGFILVVSFDPADMATADAFRARNGVSPAVPLYGPFNGELDNAQDSVELVRPDAPEPAGGPDAGFVPYILVERVKYSDSVPWPVAADGIGSSLQRIYAAAYGDDPTNWVAATPTPGAAYGGGAPPTIDSQPTDIVGVAGQSATFNVTPGGPGPFRYQWLFNGSILPGATNATLTLNNLQTANAGPYQVVVLNPANSVASSSATLTVLVPPSIVSQPMPLSVHPGTNIAFGVAVAGTTPFSYQWRKNGLDLPGANSPAYSIVNVQPPDAGTYSVLVTNSASSILSTNAALIVFTNPVIIINLTNITARGGTNVTNGIVATTSTPITYQWRRDGTNIIGATNSTFIITNVQPSNQGVFTVLLANSYGSILSSTSLLSVLITPAYAQQPMISSGPFGPATNLTVLQGATVTISVAATGSPLPLGFRWRWKPANPPTASTRDVLNTNLFATNATYTLVDVNPTNSGNYNLVITNTAGTAGLSITDFLTVLADNDRDGIDDDWERLYGMDTNSVANASADPDMDGMTNLQEYLAGTDPTNGLSYLKIDSIVLNNATNTLLTLSAVSNRTYSVICRDDVATGMWVRLADVDARATNRIVTVTNQLPAGAPYRFYRLQTPRLP